MTSPPKKLKARQKDTSSHVSITGHYRHWSERDACMLWIFEEWWPIRRNGSKLSLVFEVCRGVQITRFSLAGFDLAATANGSGCLPEPGPVFIGRPHRPLLHAFKTTGFPRDPFCILYHLAGAKVLFFSYEPRTSKNVNVIHYLKTPPKDKLCIPPWPSFSVSPSVLDTRVWH